jgi:peroxiredoxin
MEGSIGTADWSKVPAPTDDGAAKHLVGLMIAPIALRCTDGRVVNLLEQRGRVVVYAYPRTGVPGVENPDGWDGVPGARGCTPQSCAFRTHFDELRSLGIDAVYGLSTQETSYQREAAVRLHLPFAILSDENLKLTRAMDLPTFTIGGMTLLKRFTLIIERGRIEKVFYPVFPPDANAGEVVRWLKLNPK